MVQPITAFNAFPDAWGGTAQLSWAYQQLPATWKLYLFKKAASAPTDQQITDYFAGQLTDEQLRQAGLYVFRSLPADPSFTLITDLALLNGTTYYYRAVVQDTTSKEVSATVDVNVTCRPQISINSVDGKTLLILGIEKMHNTLKYIQAVTGDMPKGLVVRGDHAILKEESFWVVVQRTSGQQVESYLGNLIAQFNDQIVQGEVDFDIFSVEWICVGDPARRDNYTNIMRAGRRLLNHYLMKMGNNDIRAVRFVMLGDSQGDYFGAAAVKGTMNVVIVVEQQVQIGGAAAVAQFDPSVSITFENTEFDAA